MWQISLNVYSHSFSSLFLLAAGFGFTALDTELQSSWCVNSWCVTISSVSTWWWLMLALEWQSVWWHWHGASVWPWCLWDLHELSPMEEQFVSCYVLQLHRIGWKKMGKHDSIDNCKWSFSVCQELIFSAGLEWLPVLSPVRMQGYICLEYEMSCPILGYQKSMQVRLLADRFFWFVFFGTKSKVDGRHIFV